MNWSRLTLLLLFVLLISTSNSFCMNIPTATTTTTTTNPTTTRSSDTPETEDQFTKNVTTLIQLLKTKKLNESKNLKDNVNQRIENIKKSNPSEKENLKYSEALKIAAERGFHEICKSIISIFEDNHKAAQECIEHQSGPLNRNALMVVICSFRYEMVSFFYEQYSNKVDWIKALQKQDLFGETALTQLINLPITQKNNVSKILNCLFPSQDRTCSESENYLRELKTLLTMKNASKEDVAGIIEKNTSFLSKIKLANLDTIISQLGEDCKNIQVPENTYMPATITISESDLLLLNHYLSEGFGNSQEAMLLFRKFEEFQDKQKAINLLCQKDKSNKTIIEKVCIRGYSNFLSQITKFFKQENKIIELYKLCHHQSQSGSTAFIASSDNSIGTLNALLDIFKDDNGKIAEDDLKILQKTLKKSSATGQTALIKAIQSKKKPNLKAKALLSPLIYSNTEEGFEALRKILNYKQNNETAYQIAYRIKESSSSEKDKKICKEIIDILKEAHTRCNLELPTSNNSQTSSLELLQSPTEEEQSLSSVEKISIEALGKIKTNRPPPYQTTSSESGPTPRTKNLKKTKKPEKNCTTTTSISNPQTPQITNPSLTSEQRLQLVSSNIQALSNIQQRTISTTTTTKSQKTSSEPSPTPRTKNLKKRKKSEKNCTKTTSISNPQTPQTTDPNLTLEQRLQLVNSNITESGPTSRTNNLEKNNKETLSTSPASNQNQVDKQNLELLGQSIQTLKKMLKNNTH